MMNWEKIAEKQPPINKPVLIAYGYIYDDDENIGGYDILKFGEYDLPHLELSSNTKFVFYKGTPIAYWCEIIEPGPCNYLSF